jgi:hypothetical protein
MVVHLPLEQAVEVRILVPQPIRHLHSMTVGVFFMVARHHTKVELWLYLHTSDFILPTSYFQLHTSDFILPTSFAASRKLFHTGLAVEVAIRTIWANGIFPDDASQVSASQIGTRQIGAMEVGAAQIGTTQIGTTQIGTAQIDP